MGSLHEFRLRHNQFTQNIDGYVSGIIDDNQDLLNLNREQLLDGKKANGNAMPKYSNVSVEVYGKPTGPIRLFDTGDFHKSFTIATSGSTFSITGEDLYGLESRFGSDIYGIAKTKQPKAKQITTKELAAQYKKVCYKNI